MCCVCVWGGGGGGGGGVGGEGGEFGGYVCWVGRRGRGFEHLHEMGQDAEGHLKTRFTRTHLEAELEG